MIHLDESILDELEPYVEAAVETGLLSESEAIQLNKDGRLDAFVEGTDGGFWFIEQTASGVWN